MTSETIVKITATAWLTVLSLAILYEPDRSPLSYRSVGFAAVLANLSVMFSITVYWD